MNGKSKNSVIIVSAVLAVIYVVALIAIPFEKNMTFWIAFAFGLISIVAGSIVCFISFNDSEDMKSKVYGFPIFRLGYIYVIIQLILSLTFVVIGSFSVIPFWIALVSGVVLLGVLIVGVIAIDNAKEYVLKQEINDEIKNKTVESFRVDIDSIMRKCSDERMKKEIEKLAEDFRYSDPVSSDATKEIENTIKVKISELSESLGGDTDGVLEKVTEISELLSKRNEICKSNK